MKESRAVQILVFGILSLVVCPFFGVAAWLMSDTDLREMAQGRMDPSGRDMTKAGRICGMIGTGILALQLLIIFVAALFMALASP